MWCIAGVAVHESSVVVLGAGLVEAAAAVIGACLPGPTSRSSSCARPRPPPRRSALRPRYRSSSSTARRSTSPSSYGITLSSSPPEPPPSWRTASCAPSGRKGAAPRSTSCSVRPPTSSVPRRSASCCGQRERRRARHQAAQGGRRPDHRAGSSVAITPTRRAPRLRPRSSTWSCPSRGIAGVLRRRRPGAPAPPDDAPEQLAEAGSPRTTSRARCARSSRSCGCAPGTTSPLQARDALPPRSRAACRSATATRSSGTTPTSRAARDELAHAAARLPDQRHELLPRSGRVRRARADGHPEVVRGEAGRDDQVRVWVAGCATGEEAYSLGMLLLEHAATLHAPPQSRSSRPTSTRARSPRRAAAATRSRSRGCLAGAAEPLLHARERPVPRQQGAPRAASCSRRTTCCAIRRSRGSIW